MDSETFRLVFIYNYANPNGFISVFNLTHYFNHLKIWNP